MEPLINFRLLADELSSSEFILFIQTIASTTNGRQQIIQGLFQQNMTKSPTTINRYNNIISNIINKRQNANNHDIAIESETTTASLFNLPYALISESASFLEMREYFTFARCNRKTYLALYQQPKLSCSPFEIFVNCNESKIPPSFQYNVFRNCQSVEINTALFTDTIPFQNQFMWKSNNNITSLTLSQSSKLNLFLLRQPLNFTCIKRLGLRYLDYPSYGQIDYAQNAQSFINTFKYFPSLKALELGYITLKTNASPAIMTNPFNALTKNVQNDLSNIIHLKLWMNVPADLQLILLTTLGPQLEVLALRASDIILPGTLGFGKLEELSVYIATAQGLNGFYQDSKLLNLKRILFAADIWETYIERKMVFWIHCS